MIEKYSRLTKDRTGSQIQDMLYAYSYCYKNNIIYKGACEHIHARDNDNYRMYKSINDTEKLCKLIGIPKPIIDNNIFDSDKILFDYSSQNTNEIFNKKFIELLYNNAKCNLVKINTEFTISLHIRRGDVRKDNKWFFRYVDDDYYIKILTAILKVKPNAKIYLFSDGNENFNEFKKLGCILKINSDIVEAWNYFIQSNILIMGSSSFSIIPGILNINGIVVYTWSKYFEPLDHWICDNNIDIKIKKIINKLI